MEQDVFTKSAKVFFLLFLLMFIVSAVFAYNKYIIKSDYEIYELDETDIQADTLISD